MQRMMILRHLAVSSVFNHVHMRALAFFSFFFYLKSVNAKDWKSLRHKTGAVMSELCASPHGMCL